MQTIVTEGDLFSVPLPSGQEVVCLVARIFDDKETTQLAFYKPEDFPSGQAFYTGFCFVWEFDRVSWPLLGKCEDLAQVHVPKMRFVQRTRGELECYVREGFSRSKRITCSDADSMFDVAYPSLISVHHSLMCFLEGRSRNPTIEEYEQYPGESFVLRGAVGGNEIFQRTIIEEGFGHMLRPEDVQRLSATDVEPHKETASATLERIDPITEHGYLFTEDANAKEFARRLERLGYEVSVDAPEADGEITVVASKRERPSFLARLLVSRKLDKLARSLGGEFFYSELQV